MIEGAWLLQDEENPVALADICLAWICLNLRQLCERRSDGSLCFHRCPVFPQELADQLLCRMAEEGVLNDGTIGIFRSHEHLRLRRALLRSSHLSAEPFRLAICPHRLQELDVSRIKGDLTVSDVLLSLANEECRESLQKLVLTGLDLRGENVEASSLSFSALRGVKSLGLAGTELDDSGLEDVSALPLLEALDISNTNVTDLRALLGCQASLRSLTAHGLTCLDMTPAQLLYVLSHLPGLRHLDLSDNTLNADRDCVVKQLLEEPGILPSLVSLDVSGHRELTDAAIQAFVEARPGMTFIGLLATQAGFCDFFTGKSKLKVAGEANIAQISEALHRYSERECFVREALVHLYSLTNDSDEPQPDVLKLVSTAMQSHAHSLHVQLLATACVFNLTSQDLAIGIPLRLLGNIVRQLLAAMRNFPNHEQLQKNCLLTLCSDRILQDVPFDRFEAAKLVMMWLSTREDQTLQRMAVAIVSILVTACMLSYWVSWLLSVLVSLQQLLCIVQQKASVGVVDSTLKFALSALWNLTDETPTACQHFIECQGLELYVEVLESYYSESSIQQKVLGLLNNIAEVAELRTELLDEDLVQHVLNLLQSPEVEVGVSYFAGGILANLASSGEATWNLDLELRNIVVAKLHSAIMTWTPPEREMVSYRTFQPFYPLLDSSQPTGVQLWAVWAMNLVCGNLLYLFELKVFGQALILNNCFSFLAPHYGKMLQDEGGFALLKTLITHPNTHNDVRRLAEGILCSLEQQQCLG
uniref:Protein zer-1 homolog-like C-terminal domain-containing protein n=1 Tax=Denticeps clupeoides TaxID=299321 RepID=A0AAY4D8A6_9TELE